MRFSIAEVLALIAWVALNLAGLLSHESVSWAAVVVNFALMIAFAISALVAVGPHRAFAISFLVPVVLYWCVVLTISKNEMAMSNGQLPTSRAFQAMLKPNVGNVVNRVTVLQRKKHAESLMPCGHAAVTVLLGYMAGKYGRYVHCFTRKK